MANNGMKADPEGLQQMASQLRASTSRLDAVAEAAPPMPEVTISSDKVGHTLSEIMKTAGAIAAGVEDVANKIDASDGSYAETDNRNSEDLNQVPKFTR